MSMVSLHHEELSKSFSMSQTFSEMSTAYQEGTPSEMFIPQTAPSSPPAQRQGKPFFRPAKNPVLERLQ